LSTYDIVLSLKPLQIPLTKHQPNHSNDASTSDSSSLKTFPVVGYDPVGTFIDESRESFGSVANFYFNRNSNSIGVKFVPRVAHEPTDKALAPNKPVFDPALLVQDLQILGHGLIKDVQINFET
jgi:hypothetical protein